MILNISQFSLILFSLFFVSFPSLSILFGLGLFLFNIKKIKIDTLAFLVFFFAVSDYFIKAMWGEKDVLQSFFSIISIIGLFSYCQRSSSESTIDLKMLLLLPLVILSAFHIFSFFITYFIGGDSLILIRQLINVHYFIIGDYQLYNSPLSNSVFSALNFLLMLIVFEPSFSLRKRLISVLMICLTVTVSIIMQGRTTIILLGVALLLVFIFSKLRQKVFLSSVCAFVLVYYASFISQIDDLKIFSRFQQEGIESPRFKLWESGFIDVFSSGINESLGGYQADLIGHSAFHNLFLDIWNSSGLLPLSLLFILFIFSYFFIIRLYFKSKNTLDVKFVAFAFLGYSAAVFGEPIQDASFYFYAYIFVIIGMVSGFNKSLYRE